MSKKRRADELSTDEQLTTGNPDGILAKTDNAKRGKFASFSETTLQDLPTEMLECIVVQAVAMEVLDMKLAKSVWKEKADLVINRLRTVCSHWNCILNTKSFRNKLHRTLDGIARDTIRLEILHEAEINCFALKVAALKDEVVVFCADLARGHLHQSCFAFKIRVYDHNNIAKMKDVISLPEVDLSEVCTGGMAACNLSNCVYVLMIKFESHCSSILRIAREEGLEFNVLPWMNDLAGSFTSMFVSEQGNLLILSTSVELNSHTLSIYGPNGVLQQELMLSPDVYGFKYIKSVLQKSSGNFVLDSVNEQLQTCLTEINVEGVVQRQFTSSRSEKSGVYFADDSGRILIKYLFGGIDLLDSELNLLDLSDPLSNQELDSCLSLHYNAERNEVLGYRCVFSKVYVLAFFRFSKV